MDQKFQEFVGYAMGSRDVSLAVSSAGFELAGWEEQLLKAGWKKAESIAELAQKISTGGKYYLLFNEFATEDELKPAYDFALQYPAGQVSVFDEQKMANLALSPNYEDSGIIYLFTQAVLDKAKEKSFQFVGNCGLTFKN